MYPVEIIPARSWRNAETGATASLYGAVPYLTAADAAAWSVVETGFTLRMSNGTVGCGRLPFETRDAAADFANRWLDRVGRSERLS